MVMLVQKCVQQIVDLSPAEIGQMTKSELLEAIWAAELAYRPASVNRECDHRKCLDRSELEHVLKLVQQVLHRRRG